ncbi:hypothetical protein M3B04_09915 [Corynebacterium sanguinis]|uniref:hypothetical protein n=1 Tax=Corynebacterium sanguinis TaxID=2594913 RepID=UPI00223ABC2F|nr:hypothetical protein [Corynebacterium sanguinis]MCT1629242.1 hypothetical protein [Corynebacterium sanguinis]
MTNDQESENRDGENHEPDNDKSDPREQSDFMSASETLKEFIKRSYPNPMADFSERMRQAMPPPSEELLKALGRVEVPPLGIDYAKVLKSAQPAFDASAIMPKYDLPASVGENLRKTLDQAYADVFESTKVLSGLTPVLESAKTYSEDYVETLAPDPTEPLPYLERFSDKFLTVYGSMMLAASRVEYLMADLCETHFGEGNPGGAASEAQQYAESMRKALAERAQCAICRGIAEEAQEPLMMRNKLVHGTWSAGEDIASDEEKARHQLLGLALPETVVTKRKMIREKQFTALLQKLGDGNQEAFEELFETQLVSLGLVRSFLEEYTTLGNAFEEELHIHEEEDRIHA